MNTTSRLVALTYKSEPEHLAMSTLSMPPFIDGLLGWIAIQLHAELPISLDAPLIALDGTTDSTLAVGGTTSLAVMRLDWQRPDLAMNVVG